MIARQLIADAYVICSDRRCGNWVRIPRATYVFIRDYYCKEHDSAEANVS